MRSCLAVVLFLPFNSGIFHTGRFSLFELEQAVFNLALPRLRVGFAIGIEEVFTALLPCGLHFWRRDVPIRADLSSNCTKVLVEFLNRRTAKKPIAVVDLVYNEVRFQNNDMGIIGL